jgi:uncharacterized protein (TIGR02118 family)
MIKVVYCFRKRPGMSHGDFDSHWRDVHALIGARIPGLRRFVQSRTILPPGDARAPDFDGIAELWFDDPRSLIEARKSTEWHESGLDEQNFIDAASTAYAVTEEREIALP